MVRLTRCLSKGLRHPAGETTRWMGGFDVNGISIPRTGVYGRPCECDPKPHRQMVFRIAAGGWVLAHCEAGKATSAMTIVDFGCGQLITRKGTSRIWWGNRKKRTALWWERRSRLDLLSISLTWAVKAAKTNNGTDGAMWWQMTSMHSISLGIKATLLIEVLSYGRSFQITHSSKIH